MFFFKKVIVWKAYFLVQRNYLKEDFQKILDKISAYFFTF